MAYCPPPVSDDDATVFRKLVMDSNWHEVIEKYKSHTWYHKITVIGKGTALHIATNANKKDEVKLLVQAILDLKNQSCLAIMNERGATPLHLAAYRGFTDVCELIIGTDGARKYLIQKKNNDGETPLFWAVCGHRKLVYIYLQQFYPHDLHNAFDKNGISILQIAIQRDMFDLAIIIMHFNEALIQKGDKNQITPLAYLATRRSAFKFDSMLPWWKQILYYGATITLSVEGKVIMDRYTQDSIFKKNENNAQGYIPVRELEVAYNITPSQKFGSVSRSPSLWNEIKTMKKKHIYGGLLFQELLEKIQFSGEGEYQEPDIESNHGGEYEPSPDVPTNQPTSGESSTPETNQNIIEDSKHTDGENTTIMAEVKNGSVEIMEGINSKLPIIPIITSDKNGLLLVAMKNIKTGVKRNDKTSAYLNAASHGMSDMMEGLISKIRSAIDETNSNDENALLLAVKNRQPLVIEYLWTSLPDGVFDNLALQYDKNENTVLHLAACTPFEGENTWRISGFALQMMWDIKWYKYIKTLVPDTFIDRVNRQGKTPSEIFKEDHKELLQKSVEWMRDTAESCSVVAALIAGVSFATSGSVPGGNQQSGEPSLEGQPAFKGFAISSLIGLYFSVISLIMFLSILTSRKEVEDFCLDLPMKLLFGLSSLFVSIVSMLVSFCAGHFFVLTEKYAKRDILFYLYVSIFLPVAFYAFVQFPLFLDLVLVIFKKVPPPSIKGVLI